MNILNDHLFYKEPTEKNQIKKPKQYAKECVRRSIAESSPVDIPNIEYSHISNPTYSFVRKKTK